MPSSSATAPKTLFLLLAGGQSALALTLPYAVVTSQYDEAPTTVPYYPPVEAYPSEYTPCHAESETSSALPTSSVTIGYDTSSAIPTSSAYPPGNPSYDSQSVSPSSSSPYEIPSAYPPKKDYSHSHSGSGYPFASPTPSSSSLSGYKPPGYPQSETPTSSSPSYGSPSYYPPASPPDEHEYPPASHHSEDEDCDSDDETRYDDVGDYYRKRHHRPGHRRRSGDSPAHSSGATLHKDAITKNAITKNAISAITKKAITKRDGPPGHVGLESEQPCDEDTTFA